MNRPAAPRPSYRHRAQSSVPPAWHRSVSPAVDPPHRRRWPLAAVFTVLVLGFMLLHSYAGKARLAEAFSAAASNSAQKAAAARVERLQLYKTTVNNIIAAHPDQDIAVSSIDLSDNSLTSLGDTGTFTGASTAKLITAIAILHQTELGAITLQDSLNGVSVQTLLQNMIVDSDNDAWQTLNTYLTHQTLEDYMTSQGWKDYDPDVNTFIPADMARLMQQLYEGKLISPAHKQLLLGLMQQASKQEYIVDSTHTAGPGYTVYHKAGWLDGLMHDVAIISNGKQTIVLTIYTYSGTGVGDNPDTQATFKAITDAALQAYFPSD